VVDGRRRRREVQGRPHRSVHLDPGAHVGPDERERRIVEQVLDIARPAGEEIVHAHHLVAFAEEALAEMGSDEPGAARDHRAPEGYVLHGQDATVCPARGGYMRNDSTFGRRLREARREAGLSQSELELRSGIPKARLSRYENGHVLPSIGTLGKLARALVVSEAALPR